MSPPLRISAVLRHARQRFADAVAIREPPPGVLPADVDDRVRQFEAIVTAESVRDDVMRLPSPRSRLHAPQRIAASEELLSSAFASTGWSVEVQPITAKGRGGRLDYGTFGPTRYSDLHGRNLIATRTGNDSGAVVLLAHQDTVRGSPGANDNGAALAVLLAVARLLGEEAPRRSIVLAVTDMEEIGMFGSRALVPELRRRFTIVTGLNLETIGYLSHEPHSQLVPKGFGLLYPDQVARVDSRDYRGDFLAVLYNQQATHAAATFAATLATVVSHNATLLLRAPTNIPLLSGILRGFVPVVNQVFRGDHAAFWDAGLPALQITDTANLRYPHYHSPADTPDKLDFGHIRNVAITTAITVQILAGADINS